MKENLTGILIVIGAGLSLSLIRLGCHKLKKVMWKNGGGYYSNRIQEMMKGNATQKRWQ